MNKIKKKCGHGNTKDQFIPKKILSSIFKEKNFLKVVGGGHHTICFVGIRI